MFCPLIHATMNNASMQHQHSISASAMSTSQHGSIAQQTIASNDG